MEHSTESINDRIVRVLDILASVERDLDLALDSTADPFDSALPLHLYENDLNACIEILVDRFGIDRPDPNYPHNA